MDVTIVGAGISGATVANVLSSRGHRVKVFETRWHVGGNCADYKKQGVFLHQYGAHIFHTSNSRVWNFVNTFSDFYVFNHVVYANTRLGRVRIPLDKSFTDRHGDITEQDAIDLVFRDYSEKQWGVPWEKLPTVIQGRVPSVLDTYREGYFIDTWQGVPVNGYTSLIESMLAGSDVRLGCGEDRWRYEDTDLVIYTGRPDTLFNHCKGSLKFRTLEFQHVLSARRDTCVINECNKKPYTRSYDNSYWAEDPVERTVVTYEFPGECKDDTVPYYPYPDKDNLTIYSQYDRMARENNIILLGRLGRYKYLNMDEAILEALELTDRIRV